MKVILKSGRNPKMELTLSEVTGSTTIQSLKESVQSHLGGASVVSAEKVKILLNKKPIPTSKTKLAEALEGSDVQGQSEIELSVMVMGGAPDPPAQAADVPKPATPVPGNDGTDTPVSAAGGDAMEGVEKTDEANAAAEKSHEILGAPQFWSELEAYLTEKLPSSDQAKLLRTTFEEAWRSSTSGP